MLTVKIELNSAITGLTTEIGRLYIWNEGGTRDRGDYHVAVLKKDKLDSKNCKLDSPDVCRHGSVTNYPRLSYNVWRLITRALKAAFPEEAGPSKGKLPCKDCGKCLDCLRIERGGETCSAS
jgi:hypothetical protein